MKQKNIFLLTLFLNIMVFQGLLAQQAVIAAGSDATGNNGSVTWSVGQTAFSTIIASNTTITEGVQQPFEIQYCDGIRDGVATLQCKVSPNPSPGILCLSLENSDVSGFMFELRDVNGKLLFTAEINSQEADISLEQYHSSVYFLSLFRDHLLVKTFRIIKL